MMRKAWSMVLAVILLCGGLLPRAAMASASISEADYRSALDIVIVMDHSNSMNQIGNAPGNDPKGYRVDAAQMLIAMADIKSRAAFIPFAGEPMSRYGTGFVKLDTERARTNMIDAVGNIRNQGTLPNTDLGHALNAALQLLLERGEDEQMRTPMIIALTDGQNDIRRQVSGGTQLGLPNHTVLEWDDQAQAFQYKTYKEYHTSDADLLMKEASEIAATNGIPIYTIALHAKPDSTEAKWLASQLKNISNQTEAKSELVTDPAQLPEYFGALFAQQINSEMMRLEGRPVKGKVGRYRVNIPILNSSVKEANIFVSLEKIRQAGGKPELSLYAVTETGGLTDMSAGGDGVLLHRSKNFFLYKIEPKTRIGDWVMEFELENDQTNPSDITFSLLYNYDISLKSQLSRKNEPLIPGKEGYIPVYKDDLLRLVARFYTLAGQPSDDNHLYDVHPEDPLDNADDWRTIKARYTLRDGAGQIVGQQNVPIPADYQQFAVDINFRQIVREYEYNILRQGYYTLQIQVKGAGLTRSEEIPLLVLNRPPQAQQSEFYLEVKRDATEQDSNLDPGPGFSIPVLFADAAGQEDQEKIIFYEPDGERLSLPKLTVQTGRDDLVALTVVQDEDGSVSLKGQTRLDADGLTVDGEVEYLLEVEDGDGGELKLPVKIEVRSLTREQQEKYRPELTVEGHIAGDGRVDKNTNLVFKVHLVNKEQNQRDTGGEIEKYTGIIQLFNADNTSHQAEEIDLVLDKASGELRGEYKTPNHAVDYIARASLRIGSDKHSGGKSDYKPIRVENQRPEPVSDAASLVPQQISFDSLPEFLSFLEEPAAPETLVVDVNKLFTDRDNENWELNLMTCPLPEVYRLGDAGPAPDQVLKVEELEPGRFQLVPVGEGQVELRVTVRDGDGEEPAAPLVLTIRLVSVPLKWQRNGLIALVSLIALIILILFIRQARKPRFPNDGVLLTMENDALFPSDQYEFVPTKKPLPLGRLLNDDLIHRYGFSQKELANIMLRPKRNRMGNIAISRKKPSDRLVVELDGTPVGKKVMLWERDRELILRKAGETRVLRVRFVRAGDIGMHQESESFSWDDPQHKDFFNS